MGVKERVQQHGIRVVCCCCAQWRGRHHPGGGIRLRDRICPNCGARGLRSEYWTKTRPDRANQLHRDLVRQHHALRS